MVQYFTNVFLSRIIQTSILDDNTSLRGEKYINEVVGVVEHLHLKLGTQLMHKLEKPKI